MVLKFAAGGAAGGLGSIAGNPFDVLKTRMMASEGASVGLGAVSKDIYATSGVGGFYKGMDANVARAVVNNGTKMVGCAFASPARRVLSPLVSRKPDLAFVIGRT